MMGAAAAESEEASEETRDRGLFSTTGSTYKGCTLDAPHHVGLVDDMGAPIVRGTHVLVTRVLEPKEPGGEIRYAVKYQRADQVRTGDAWQILTVPEGWLRGKGTLATSQNVDYTAIGPLLAKSAATGGLQIPLFQRRYCWTEAQWGAL